MARAHHRLVNLTDAVHIAIYFWLRGTHMIRRALFILALAGIYIMVKRIVDPPADGVDHAAKSQWANEGGRHSPVTV
jgi:hypothetical protein